MTSSLHTFDDYDTILLSIFIPLCLGSLGLMYLLVANLHLLTASELYLEGHSLVLLSASNSGFVSLRN